MVVNSRGFGWKRRVKELSGFWLPTLPRLTLTSLASAEGSLAMLDMQTFIAAVESSPRSFIVDCGNDTSVPSSYTNVASFIEFPLTYADNALAFSVPVLLASSSGSDFFSRAWQITSERVA